MNWPVTSRISINHVKEIEFSLASYGQGADELMMSVFMAYDVVEDEYFVLYIKMKRNIWEEGNLTLTLSGLLLNAENHYELRMQQEKWKAPSKKDEQIIALKALLSGKQSLKDTEGGKKKKPYEERQKEDKIKNPWKYLPPKEGESNVHNTCCIFTNTSRIKMLKYLNRIY
jgi:hypothetical protein